MLMASFTAANKQVYTARIWVAHEAGNPAAPGLAHGDITNSQGAQVHLIQTTDFPQVLQEICEAIRVLR